MTSDDLIQPAFRYPAAKSARRPSVPRGTSVLDIPIGGTEPKQYPIVRRQPEAEASMTALPPETMAQRHARTIAEYLAPSVGAPRARAIAQTLLGGQESAIPFGLGLQEFVPFSPYVGEEAGRTVAEGVQEGSPLTVGLGLGMGALQALPAAKPIAAGAKQAATSLAPKAGEMAQQYMQAIGAMPSVVKPKGGNWISGAGSPEWLTDALKQGTDTPWIGSPAEIAQANRASLQNLRETGAPQEIIESAERRVHRSESNVALNNWIDQKLNRYVRNEMGTPEDPVRKLAQEKGVSHLPEEELRRSSGFTDEAMRQERVRGGYPEEGMAVEDWMAVPHEQMTEEALRRAEMAHGWENLADYPITGGRVGSYTKEENPFREMFIRENPWMKNVDPNAEVYHLNPGMGVHPRASLGFSHIVDELQNAMSLRSDLPKSLQIRPDDLKKMSMTQVVERVAKINEFRADKAAKSKLEAQKNVDVFKEYPTIPGTMEPNERGLRWVELNKPGHFAYESDRMGHSVRGYEPPDKGGNSLYGLGGWDAIQSGKAKIYSLRDAKGEPHVTIEIARGKPWNERSGVFYDNPGLEPPWRDFHNAMLDRGGSAPHIKEFSDWLAKNQPEVFERYRSVFDEGPPEIRQIKGKANKSPEDKYKPFVKDFVRGGEWERVGDLHNTGFDLQAKDLFDPDQMAAFNVAGVKVPKYMTRDEARALSDKLYEIETGKSAATGLPRTE